jgi:hypothetical protein
MSGFKRGNQGRGMKTRVRHLYAQRWVAEMVGSSTAEHGSAGREKKGLTCGAHMSVIGKEKRCFSGMRKPEGKIPFSEYAKASRAGWAERGGDGL